MTHLLGNSSLICALSPVGNIPRYTYKMKSLAQSIAIFVLVLSVAIPANISAARLTFVSDLISTSAPTTDATHTIQFTIVATIPAGGRIIITPQNSAFTIPAALNYTDMHLAVSSGGGPYIARSLSAVASALDDGITVVSGTTGSITITLNSSVGIIAGD